MKLTVLLDNNTIIDRYFLAEPALSFFIEDDGKIILFDAGYSSAFIENAKKMKIDLACLDYVVLSHGHVDHTAGLKHLMPLLKKSGRRPTLVCHPLVFAKRKDKRTNKLYDSPSLKMVQKYFEVVLTEKPFALTKRLFFLGEIPRKFGFESMKAARKIFRGEKFMADIIYDDSSLVYTAKDGLVIITGCAHAGVCNTTAYALSLFGEQKVKDIIGGLHLLKPQPKKLCGSVSFIKRLKPAQIHPCHCTDFTSKCALAKVAHVEDVGVGLKLEFK